MNKRGASHIEVILAFILFMGFITVSLFYFLPSNSKEFTKAVAPYFVDEVIENASIEVLRYPFYPTNPTEASVIKVSSVAEEDEGVKAISKEGDVRDIDISGNDIFIELKEGDDIIYLLVSREEGFGGEEVTLTGTELVYESGPMTREKIVYEPKLKKIIELNDEKGDDYKFFKETFGIPRRIDAGLNVEYIDKSSEETINLDERPSSEAVYSEARNVLFMDENGKTGYGSITAVVW